MTRPQPGRTAQDVPRLMSDFLATSTLVAKYPKLYVALELPPKWAPESGPPVLLVENDGDPAVIWPVGTSETLRLTSWTRGRDRRYISDALSLVLGTPIPGITKVLPGTLILDDRDPTTGADLSSITVRTRARLAQPQ